MAAPAKKGSQEEELIFGGFSEDRRRIDRIVERLDVTEDLVERADLGSELVQAVSRYEDTFERTVRPRLEGFDADLLTAWIRTAKCSAKRWVISIIGRWA